ncbi:MAG: amino acid ABC transporter permease [Proteobacteria bacterium]|nr:amino acid ABC transporter permease [Pseudomonadota bacterium]
MTVAEVGRPRASRAPLKLRKRSPIIDVLQVAVLAAVLIWFTLKGAGAINYNWQWYRVPVMFYRVVDGEFILGPLIEGLFMTLKISGAALILALFIGLATALLRRSNSYSGRALAYGYLELIRNTPLIVQIYLFYFVLAPIVGTTPFWTGVIALAVFEGSFTAEIFRAGIESVKKGQWEASDSLGLPRHETFRRVVLPQALPLMLPPLTGQMVSLIKHSAILSAVAVFDLTTVGLDLIADTFMAFEVWLSVAGVYLALTITLSVSVSLFENRIRKRAQHW